MPISLRLNKNLTGQTLQKDMVFPGIRGEALQGVASGFICANPSKSDGNGVEGAADQDGDGVVGTAVNGRGVLGESDFGNGVHGIGKEGYGVAAESSNTYALYARGAKAATFIGDIDINGNINSVNTVTVSGDVVLTGGDCAEHFDVAEAQQLEPGTVVVIDQDGALRESRDAYDKKVAGVVSGAGDYRPAIVLDKRASSDRERSPVALVGKVYCKVDASYAAIEVGDLLTTSPTAGHAMKATDPSRAFGAVIGKALRPLEQGRHLVPILVALQ